MLSALAGCAGGGGQSALPASPDTQGSRETSAVKGASVADSVTTTDNVARQAVSASTEVPVMADAFVDSIGVNAHFERSDTPYGTQFAQVSKLLVASGIRHVRVGMDFNNSTYPSHMKQLADSGVHAEYTTGLGNSESAILGFVSEMSGTIEAIEAPNEQDNNGNSNWASEVRNYEKSLYGWIKGNSATARFPLIGPSLVSANSYPRLGDLSSYLDYGNTHDYFASVKPGTPGYGSNTPYGRYGSAAYNLNLEKVVAGSKPVFATETGYGTMTGKPGQVDYRTDLRYMTRLFFDQFNAGIKRTYSYELLDQGGSDTFDYYGLLQSNVTPKPAYYGIKSITSALSDPGPAFNPTPLAYELTGSTVKVDHLLLQKRNGSYILAIWIEAASWNSADGGDIIVPSQAVSLATSNHFGHASIATMDEGGNLSSASLPWNGTQGRLNVTDKISLVTLTP